MEETKEVKLKRIKQLTNDKGHIRQQALRLAGIHLQTTRDEIIERQEIDEEDSEIVEACNDQLEVIGNEIRQIGIELEVQAKEVYEGPGNTYLLSDTHVVTHRVHVDDDQACISQLVTFGMVADDIEMLIAVLQGMKSDKNVPHSFSNVNARYNYSYKPAGAGNSFVIRHMSTSRTIGMHLPTALQLLNALTGKTEHLTRIGKGGPSLVPPTRRKVWVKIQEMNNPPAPNTFDISVAYPSDKLPEWFSHLQPIVEDTTFTSMEINIGQTCHHITLFQDGEEIIKPVEID